MQKIYRTSSGQDEATEIRFTKMPETTENPDKMYETMI